MPDTEGVGVVDTRDSTEKQVPKEKITEIVNNFAKLYEVDLQDASCDFEVEYIKGEEWNKLAEMEISSSLGVQGTLSRADIEKFVARRAIPLGEWIAEEGKGKGYLLEMSEEECSKACQDHILKHEIMHAISLRTGGGFYVRSIYQAVLDGDGFLPNRKNLSEGATEVLALGLALNTTDPIEIVQVIKQRISAIRSSKSEQKEIGDMKTYIGESLNVLAVLKLAGISIKEMASYYAKGDFQGFAGKVAGVLNQKYPKRGRSEEENTGDYFQFLNYMQSLGMDTVYYDILKKEGSIHQNEGEI